MKASKKQWTRPQLIVLARGTPDESVLEHCKDINSGRTGAIAASQQNQCGQSQTDCGACLSRGGQS
jgi:hypothetical protein